MRVLIATLVLLAAVCSSALAVIPPTMNFQGKLTDGFGSTVPDGSYTVMFSLHNVSSGGAALWSEVQTVSTANGLFNVILGSATPIPATALMDTAAYLELAVESDPPLSPRTRLTSTAYSVVTSSLIGGGPIHMNLYDPSSGSEGSVHLDLEQSAATNDRVKTQLHWDSHYPATGDSSIVDIVLTADSTYESKRMHKPFRILKTVDKASPLASELSIVSTSNSTDSVSYSRIVSTTDGILETNSSATPTAQATGKRQHRPVTFSKEWGAVNSSRSLASSSIFTLDSGFTQKVSLTEGDVTVEMLQQANYPDVVTARNRPYVFPHLLEVCKSQNGSTGDTAKTRFFVDADSGCTRSASVRQGDHRIVSIERLGAPPEGGTAIPDINRVRASTNQTTGDSSMCWCHFDSDSGYATRIAVHQGNESMESLNLIGAPPVGAIARPNLLEARKSQNESTNDSASTWNFVDADSGCGETARLRSSDGTTSFSRVARAPGGTAPGAETTVFDIGVQTSSTSTGGGHAQEVLDIVAGYQKSAGLTKTDLITTAETGTSQTREHILLSRQVGVPAVSSTSEMALQTNDNAATARWQRGNPTDSSGVELFADDDSTSLKLYTKTPAAGRYPNITLKRGVVGAELSLGYDFAGSGAMIYAVSSPAAGGQLGINTTSPSEAFHLVGNGCYTGTFGACSDRRYKEHIETLSDALDIVRNLRGVRFDWKRKDYPEQNFPGDEQIGLIAQEVEGVVPSVVHTGSDGYKSVDYAKLVAVLIEAVKAQEKEISELKTRLDAIEGSPAIGRR